MSNFHTVGFLDDGRVVARCRCLCGTLVVGTRQAFARGWLVHCGCYGHPAQRLKHARPGLESKTFKTWQAIRAAAVKKDIPIVSSWLNFYIFLKDMGVRPTYCRLTRTNKKQGFGPANCTWVLKPKA